VLAVLLTTATTALRPMVSYRALDLGAGELDLGIIAASFALFSLALALPLGRRVDRWGEARIVVGGLFLVTTTALVLLWVDTVWALAVSQAFLGLGQMMAVIGNQAMVARAGDPRRRDGRFGLLTVVISVGQLAGPAMAGLIAGGGVTSGVAAAGSVDPHRVFLTAAALGAVGLLVALSLWWRPDRRERPAVVSAGPPVRSVAAFRQVLAVPSMRHAMLVSLTVLTAIDVLTAYLPAYGEAHGLSVQTVGFLLSARAGASILSRVVMLPLISLLGRKRLLMGSLGLAAAAFGAFPFLDDLALQYAAMALIGLGLGLGQPVTLSWVAGRAPRGLRGTTLGIRLSGNRLGQLVLPVFIGVLAGATGVGAVFFALATMLAASGSVLAGARFDTVEEESAEVGPSG
jgi:MFS family permease